MFGYVFGVAATAATTAPITLCFTFFDNFPSSDSRPPSCSGSAYSAHTRTHTIQRAPGAGSADEEKNAVELKTGYHDVRVEEFVRKV